MHYDLRLNMLFAINRCKLQIAASDKLHVTFLPLSSLRAEAVRHASLHTLGCAWVICDTRQICIPS